MGAAGHLLFHPAFLKGAYTMGKITQDHFDLYINGKWVPAKDGATFQTRCPANVRGGADDVDLHIINR